MSISEVRSLEISVGLKQRYCEQVLEVDFEMSLRGLHDEPPSPALEIVGLSVFIGIVFAIMIMVLT